MANVTYPTRDEILALETSYWEAMKRKDGKGTAALSGKSCLVTGAKGVMVIDKAKMGAMTEDGKWELRSFDLEDVQMVTPAPDVAIISYIARQSVVMDGKSMEMRAADSSTWVRGAQGWECHGHSETMLDAPET